MSEKVGIGRNPWSEMSGALMGGGTYVRGGIAKCIRKSHRILEKKIANSYEKSISSQFLFKWSKNGFVASFCGNLSFECRNLQHFQFLPIYRWSKFKFFTKITKIAKIGPSNAQKLAKNDATNPFLDHLDRNWRR